MVAKDAIETATANIGGRCISASAGNPTSLTGKELVEIIKEAAYDPVVVMVDDRGRKGKGPGESAMAAVLDSNELDVLGIIAVSSNGKDCNGLHVNCSITKDGDIVHNAVDKYGEDTYSDKICGDTLSILKSRRNVFIVGMGDPGKMDYRDEVAKGAPVTTKALQTVMEHSGLYGAW